MALLELHIGTCSLLLAIALCSCRPTSGASLLDWIGFGGGNGNQELTTKEGVPLLKVPYEELSAEDKFLREAEKFISLKQSDLDNCQHKVVMKIHTSCGAISEEELAKLSVNLLNCQSGVEGRQQFPCTENMSLRDCTKNMDSDMWNTYHLMNNRARAVCYSARHQQFRALSEMTVNKLMTAAHEQLKAMDSIKDGQSKLESVTSGALESVSMGHQALMTEQEKLRSSTQSIHDFVALNLRELTREKALIAAGQRELALMTKDLKFKLDQASHQLTDHAKEHESNHLQVMADLEALQGKTFEIWKRVDTSTDQILAMHVEVVTDIENMLKNLGKINASIDYLLTTVEKTRSEIDEKLGWIIKFIAESGDQMEWIQRCLGHALYLVLGMVVISFIQAPFADRCALFTIVPLNLMLASREGTEGALDYPGLTILLCVFAVAHWLLSSVCGIVYPTQPPSVPYLHGTPSCSQVATSQLPYNGHTSNGIPVGPSISYRESTIQKFVRMLTWKDLKEGAWKLFNQFQTWHSKVTRRSKCEPLQARDETEEEEPAGEVETHFEAGTTYPSAFHRVAGAVSRSDSPASSRSSYSFISSRSGTPKMQCRELTKTGKLCRNSAVTGSEMCRLHSSLSPG